MDSGQPIHINQTELFCNRCCSYRNKWTQIIVIEGNIHCSECMNWLCGEWDAFGDISKPIKTGLITKEIFIPKFLSLLKRKLLEALPNEHYESEMIEQAYETIYRYTKHLSNAI